MSGAGASRNTAGSSQAEASGAGDPVRRRILESAKANLRRYGAAKTTVTDIARDLGMSHSNVYRFFRTKAEIMDAVVEDWLAEEEALLEEHSGGSGSSSERLERLVLALQARKAAMLEEDAEIFDLYRRVLSTRPAAAARYRAMMLAAFERVVSDGVRSGEFAVQDVGAAARAARHATLAFLDPAVAGSMLGEPADLWARNVVRSLAAGFANRESPPRFEA